MYDCHYDLLTKIYIDYLNRDLSNVTLFCCQNYTRNNVSGVIANLSFMSKLEMEQEYHLEYNSSDLVSMFKITAQIAKNICRDINLLFSIEGCDKLVIKDLKKLYKSGLRVIAPVWNESNQYGSGIRTNGGLTKLGEELIKKAINYGIAIDLSHANEKTFNDIVDIIENEQSLGKQVIALASHSNCYNLCPRNRNLTDKQLKRLCDINAYIGIFSNTNFISLDHLSQNEYEEYYIKHIKHVEKIYGTTDYILLSTDDMKWCEQANVSYGRSSLYEYNHLQRKMKILLSRYYSDSEVGKLMNGNAIKLFNELN